MIHRETINRIIKILSLVVVCVQVGLKQNKASLQMMSEDDTRKHTSLSTHTTFGGTFPICCALNFTIIMANFGTKKRT